MRPTRLFVLDMPSSSSNASDSLSLRRSLALVAPYFAKHRSALISLVLLTVSASALAAVEPLVIKNLFDALVGSSAWGSAWWTLVALVLSSLTREAAANALDRVAWRTRIGVNFELLSATIERLHALPLSYHRDGSVGATMTKVERGITGSMAAFSDIVTHLVPSLVYLAVSAAVMICMDWRLSLAVLAIAPFPAVIGAVASREQMAREQALMQRWTKLFGRFHEILMGILVVKSFVMEDQERRRFLDGVADTNAIVVRGVDTDARTTALKNMAMIAARAVALGLGGMLVVRGQISIGTLIAFVGYLGGLFQPVQHLTGMYQTLRRATVSLDALRSILEAEESVRDTSHARDAHALHGDIEFRDLSFTYRAGKSVLCDINLRVRPGEMVALVGPSGSGKTTIAALLQRLYDPTAGAILLDGLDLRDLKQKSLRAQIGIVLQEGSLFSDTIRDNIAFGRPDASDDEIVAAAKAAFAHEFIMALPERYQTPVGEGGCKLSGGERQRIAIARAILKNAPIMIFDEATSALDAEGEEKVQLALKRLAERRTTFVIAHRLSTVTAADTIVVLQDGRITERGRHDHLMRANGYYASLVRKQIGGFFPRAA
jgi:ATP-binding cassette subfamily B protein